MTADRVTAALPDPLAQAAADLEAKDTPSILLSPALDVVAANAAYRRLFGPAVGRKCHAVSHQSDVPCDQRGEHCPIAAVRATGHAARVLHVHHTPRGLEHVDVVVRPVHGPDGGVVAYVETLRPVDTASAQAAIGIQVGRSPAFLDALGLALRAAPSDVPVLLLGESGTGKEHMARAIHDASTRAKGPFVAVACSGLTETLFESELFGHEKGAFTGAHQRSSGLVATASGGTLFLDEIGDVPLTQQVKLLRLLEARQFRRVGGTETIAADFRLVCATWRDLEGMVGDGSFRRDLYYRIAAFPIRLPSLRERTLDLPLLAASILAELGSGLHLTDAALRTLGRREWPGNVRELRNALQRAVLLADDGEIDDVHVAPPPTAGPPAEVASTGWPWGDAVIPLTEVERRYLAWCVDNVELDRKELAQRLGVSERTLYRKLAELGGALPASDEGSGAPDAEDSGSDG